MLCSSGLPPGMHDSQSSDFSVLSCMIVFAAAVELYVLSAINASITHAQQI